MLPPFQSNVWKLKRRTWTVACRVECPGGPLDREAYLLT